MRCRALRRFPGRGHLGCRDAPSRRGGLRSGSGRLRRGSRSYLRRRLRGRRGRWRSLRRRGLGCRGLRGFRGRGHLGCRNVHSRCGGLFRSGSGRLAGGSRSHLRRPLRGGRGRWRSLRRRWLGCRALRGFPGRGRLGCRDAPYGRGGLFRSGSGWLAGGGGNHLRRPLRGGRSRWRSLRRRGLGGRALRGFPGRGRLGCRDAASRCGGLFRSGSGRLAGGSRNHLRRPLRGGRGRRRSLRGRGPGCRGLRGFPGRGRLRCRDAPSGPGGLFRSGSGWLAGGGGGQFRGRRGFGGSGALRGRR